ncbi:chitinase [Leuconostoc falkenbergense]|uniref:chitinase n=1 Tax=Leuconostoc falkenbergense TaxID=2766470 RepID=UPI0021AA079A|nr:chitinase [Leuconostoc falkenbergense]MCT4377845.1 chitinase [Leuconostoc falkenbergense]MDV8952021.1 chitinase [Leuconostoc falkenbergense]
MTIYTKTITAALALMLGAAPLVGTVSAETSDGTVTFANEAGALSIESADDIEFGTIDLASVADFTPTATNQSTANVVLSQTAANPSGTYGITVQQTGPWVSGGEQVTAANLPIQYDGTSITAAQDFVTTGTSAPTTRGLSNKAFSHDGKDFTLDLTGNSNLTNALNKSLTSEVTWTLTTGA